MLSRTLVANQSFLYEDSATSWESSISYCYTKLSSKNPRRENREQIHRDREVLEGNMKKVIKKKKKTTQTAIS